MKNLFSAKWCEHFQWDTGIFLAVYGVTALVLAYCDRSLGLIAGIVWLCLGAFSHERSRERHRHFEDYCRKVVSNINEVTTYAIENLPQAMMIVGEDGRLLWANETLTVYLGAQPNPGEAVSEFWASLPVESLWGQTGEYTFSEGDASYHAIYRPLTVKPSAEEPTGEEPEPKQLMAYYIMDITEHRQLERQYESSRTTLAYIQIDNFDEALQGLSEGERTSLLFSVNRLIDTWVRELGGFVRRVADDFYIAVMTRHALELAMADRFDILDKVRAIRAHNNMPITVSLGVVVSEGEPSEALAEIGNDATRELDLALGRGGDQVAVLIDGKTQFYGGKSQAVEKHTRVKARVVAHALRELMENASEVFVTGHQNEDFDALGAAIGVAKMAKHLGKPVYIVLSEFNDGIDKLVDMLREKGEYSNLFVRQSDALTLTTTKPLLVVVDVHIPALVAAPKLLDKISKVVVIDHHRRSESVIASPLLFYVEPSASSTSELVTELLMYFADDVSLLRLEATAIYAGIVVDTKHFSVQTGVRTFEAAAYLRRAGVDPVVIRYLFRSDFDSNIAIAKAMASAKLYEGGLIVATMTQIIPNVQVIAAQAADALLAIDGVRLAVLIFQLKPMMVGVSARSTGEINVQVLMEQFGGGGHQNVAAAQVANVALNDMIEKVTAAAKLAIQS